MNALGAIRQYCGDVVAAWNRFWFEPTDPAVLAIIRIFAGSMLFYTHFIWSFDLQAAMITIPATTRTRTCCQYPFLLRNNTNQLSR